MTMRSGKRGFLYSNNNSTLYISDIIHGIKKYTLVVSHECAKLPRSIFSLHLQYLVSLLVVRIRDALSTTKSTR